MSLVRRRGTIQSEKFAKKRRKKTIFVAVLFLVAVISVFSTFFLFFRAQFVQIQSVEISGPAGVNGGALSLVSASDVRADVEHNLIGSWLYIFSKNTISTYPRNAIRAELMKTYPAIASVSFYSSGGFLGFGKSIVLHVRITEREPFALTCAAGSAEPECFFIDSSGFIYAPGQRSSLHTYIDYELLPQSTSSSLLPGNFIADEASFSMAKRIVGFVSGMGLNVNTDFIGSDVFGSTDTVVIRGRSSETDAASSSTEIYFNQNGSLETELRYFSEFWKDQATSSDVRFRYVDMRYGKDIVYKVHPVDAPKK